jgi:peptide/nickel transport system ATP-binding protein
MLLEAINIHKSFPPEEGQKEGRYILRGAAITLNAGESVALVGPSGCGKTTLALILAGILAPDQGCVRLNGMNAWSGSRKHRVASHRCIQMVAQHPEAAFDPLWTIEKSLMEAPRIHNLAKPAIELEKILERFHLKPSLLARLPGQLSGGELQRFALIRALSLHPKVLLLDEPTAMLDAVTQTQILGIIRDSAADSGMAQLFISHDLRLVRHFCKKAWELRDGRTIPFNLEADGRRERKA